MSYLRPLLLIALAAGALVVPGAVGASRSVTQPLVATVGSASALNAFAISLKDSTGATVTHLDVGTYAVTVHDYATLHDFHLSGPGVDEATDIERTGNFSWTINVTDGTYKFVCDAHPTQMKGSFTAGSVTTPPPPPKPPAPKKLTAQVGPKGSISVKTGSGARVKTTPAGKYKLTVKDLTKTDNFHLTGGGVNRKTGVKFKGTTTWTITLHTGKVSFRSDAHKALHGGFRVVAAA